MTNRRLLSYFHNDLKMFIQMAQPPPRKGLIVLKVFWPEEKPQFQTLMFDMMFDSSKQQCLILEFQTKGFDSGHQGK